MSASTDQNARKIVGKIRRGSERAYYDGEFVWDIDSDEAATLITQAIAVEAAVLRERVRTLEGLLKMSVVHIQDQDSPLAENIHRALLGSVEASKTAAISEGDSPGAKAEDTASAEFLKKALKEAKSLARLRVSSRVDGAGGTEIIILADAAVVHERSVPTLSTYLRTKEQP